MSLLVLVSVASCTLYGTFKWSKLSIIPFFLLQAMLFLYIAVSAALLLYAVLWPFHSVVYQEIFTALNGCLRINGYNWVLILFGASLSILCFLAYSTSLLWHEYQFIAEVDRFLKSIKKSSSHASKDNNDGPPNGNRSMMM
ncbi:hypothetical protein AAVH_34637 [Aphelenchoides avenae]|nr:hypothetical protein AAVH_34637 [Aphelenchus avenae]